MPNGLIATLGMLAILLILGVALGMLNRTQFSWRWLLVALGLYLINDVLLTNAYRLVPEVIFPTSDWSWQGKLLGLIGTLAIAQHPAFGWSRVGLTFAQNGEGRPLTYSVAFFLCALYVFIALSSANDPFNADTLAFQLTMPGLDEEALFRGTALLAFNEAFRERRRMLGIRIGWGAVMSCIMFGLAHCFSFKAGAFDFDVMTFAATGLPAFLLIWFRERTGSLVLPIVLHNFANSIDLII